MIDANTAVGWKPILNEFFEQERFNKLLAFLDQENLANKSFYPPQSEIYEAFNKTPFDRVKVILLGQDPYHGIGQAHGLSFSV